MLRTCTAGPAHILPDISPLSLQSFCINPISSFPSKSLPEPHFTIYNRGMDRWGVIPAILALGKCPARVGASDCPHQHHPDEHATG